MEKNIRKEKEELSTGPRLLKRWKKAFHGKLRPRHLANILNNISSIDVDKAEKEEMAKKRSFLKNTWVSAGEKMEIFLKQTHKMQIEVKRNTKN